MGAPRIKRRTSAEHRRALSMLKLGKQATITLVIDNECTGKEAVIAAGLDREKLGERFLTYSDGRDLELVDITLIV